MRRKVARKKPASTGTIVASCVALGLGAIAAIYAGGLLDPGTTASRKVKEKGGAAVLRTSTAPEGQTPAGDSAADTPKAPRKAEAPPPKPRGEDLKPKVKVGEVVTVALYGKFIKRPHPKMKSITLWEVKTITDGLQVRISGELLKGTNAEDCVGAYVKAVVTGTMEVGSRGPFVRPTKLI
ncbi:MAG: hypothetical protein ACYTFI_22075, partial [Planctomycetota bacterium]